MAGVVESVGKSVTRFRRGDEVFGETIAAHQWTNGGAFADYVAVRQDWLALKPDNITFEQAASVPTAGFIALQNLRDVSLVGPGRKVLINGAGGGVGALALQFAKAHGAHVTAVDSTRKLSMLCSLGANEVIDYTKEDFTRRGVRYDLIFDVPGNRPLSAFRRALEPDGRYIPIGHEHFGAAGNRVFGLLPHFFRLMFLSRFVNHLRGSGLPAPTRSDTMAVLRELLEAGKITPIIDSTYPLSETREAFRHMIEDETQGKVIITPIERSLPAPRR
jgi:NADPH:quinone reductase-like Zn-dependent oxidoreductase